MVFKAIQSPWLLTRRSYRGDRIASLRAKGVHNATFRGDRIVIPAFTWRSYRHSCTHLAIVSPLFLHPIGDPIAIPALLRRRLRSSQHRLFGFTLALDLENGEVGATTRCYQSPFVARAGWVGCNIRDLFNSMFTPSVCCGVDF